MPVSRIYCEPAVKQSDDAGKAPDAPSKQHARPKKRATRHAGRKKENPLRHDHEPVAEADHKTPVKTMIASSALHTSPKREAVQDDGQEKENSVQQNSKPDAGAPALGGETKENLAEAGQVIPQGQPPAAEPGEAAVRPELSEAGRTFKNRIDSAQGRIRNQTQDADELQALLDQAVTLLESVSRHPAIRDYNANKRKLDEIEQRLGYGAYPQ